MVEVISTHPLFTILCVLLIVVVGKHLFMSKKDETTLTKDINNIAKKQEESLADAKTTFSDNMHKLELNIAREFGTYGEKIRIVQKEIMDEADHKFFTKEMAEKHNERISKMEEIIREVLPRMQKLDIMYDIVTKHKIDS